jgi:hypothetical protein
MSNKLLLKDKYFLTEKYVKIRIIEKWCRYWKIKNSEKQFQNPSE